MRIKLLCDEKYCVASTKAVGRCFIRKKKYPRFCWDYPGSPPLWWEGAGLRYRYRNRRRRTVDYRHSVPAAGGKIGVVPWGGAVRTADGERRRWGR